MRHYDFKIHYTHLGEKGSQVVTEMTAANAREKFRQNFQKKHGSYPYIVKTKLVRSDSNEQQTLDTTSRNLANR